jgi:hypothetical protein
MQRRPLNISAALALAIERQVEHIIANAKAQCALQYRAARRGDVPDPSMSGPRFAAQTDFEDPEADRWREFSEALRPWSDFASSEVPFAGPAPEQRLDLWKRVHSLLRPRPFRA